MIDRRHLLAFCRVAEAGNFSRAALMLGVGQPAISKLVGQLEQHLGTTLFIRSTRSIRLTEEGERALAEAYRVLNAYDDLVAAGRAGQRMAGTVRISCPNALASCFLIKTLAEFRNEHPEIDVRLRVTDARLDLETDDIDIAVRVGEPVLATAKAKFVGRLPRIVAAATDYLKVRGTPQSLDELVAHDCIIVSQISAATWTYLSNRAVRSVEVRAAILVDNHLALRDAVAAGFGLGLAAGFLFVDGKSMRPGIERVFSSLEFEPMPLNVLYRAERHLPARVRACIDYVVAALSRQKWLDAGSA